MTDDMHSNDNPPERSAISSLPFASLVLALACVLASGADRFLTSASYAFNMNEIAAWAAGNAISAAFIYLAATVAAFAISLPGALTMLAIAGGALFGSWVGGTLFVAGATCGSIVLFLAARPALAHRARGAAARWSRALLQREGFGIVLSLRLAPVAPPIVATLAAAALGAPVRGFIAATALGFAPAAAILAYLGSRLATGSAPDSGTLWQWPNLTVLMGLAGLTIMVVLVRLWWSRQSGV